MSRFALPPIRVCAFRTAAYRLATGQLRAAELRPVTWVALTDPGPSATLPPMCDESASAGAIFRNFFMK
jgi:hypothetical protein